MKEMRVLNCSKEDREIIFKIADKVGCPVWNVARERSCNYFDNFPFFGWNGKWIDAFGSETGRLLQPVSFSEFITELLKYEKPKKWVVKQIPFHVEKRSSGYHCYKFEVHGEHRNPKFTVEVEE